MKILILHRIPYHKINYAKGIDHERHDVVYIGTTTALANIPKDLRCRKVEREGKGSAADETLQLAANGLFTDGLPEQIISLSEYELLDAARLREKLGVRGAGVNDVLLVRDKVMMKAAVQKSGLRVPLHLGCDDPDWLTNLPWQGATVLKPRDGASSENVKLFPSYQAAHSAIINGKSGIEGFNQKTFELEEYVDGPILHIDGLISEGQIQCWLPSRYVGTCLRYAEGEPLGSVQIAATDELDNWTKRILQAVRINDGSFHLEAIESANGLVFLDVANRVGGADVVDTFEMATGVYLPAAELALRIGDRHMYDVRAVASPPRKYFGWFVFPGHHLPPGSARFTGLTFFERDRKIVRLNKLMDRPLPRQITYQSVEVPLAGVVESDSTEELSDWMNHFLHAVEIHSSADKKELACLS